jgi:ATP-binding cassette, subfamily B, bacterial MsbA
MRVRKKPPSDASYSLNSLNQLRRLFIFVHPYRYRLFLALTVIALGSLLGLAGPYTLQFLVDAVFQRNDAVMLNRITLILVAIFATQSFLYFVRAFLLTYIGERVMADLRIKLFEHLQLLSLSFYNERRTGEIVSRLTNDVSTVRSLVTSDISTALSQVLTFSGALVLILVTNWRLTLFMFALVPFVMLFAIVFGRKLRRLSSSVQDQLAEATNVMEESISGVRVVQSFAREAYVIRRFRDSIEKTFQLAMRRTRLSALFGPIISFLAFSAVVSIFWYGGHEVLAGNITPGQLLMFLILTMTIAGSIGQFSGLWTGLQEALGATQRLFELLETQPEISDSPGAIALPKVKGRITFEEVSFAYRDNPQANILSDVSLEVSPGEILALVGPSGAGKTTLVNLILRFFDPTSGRVLIDGHDLRMVKLKSLREQVGIVPQDTLLFGGSVRDNILYGKLDASDHELIQAARSANAHEFIETLPQGYETIVGERGIKLSGGQRQRIAIARAILKDPAILLMDEATSSLDSESEGQVQEALTRLMQDRTSLVIAHRLSTIQNAHRIAVMEGGSLTECGTHADLMEINGMYARLYKMQFKLDEIAAPNGENDAAIDYQAPKKQRTRGFLSGLTGG